MALDKLTAPLLRVPLLAGLTPLQLTEIARQAERIALAPMDPGEYELRLVATDRARGHKAQERVPFTIE